MEATKQLANKTFASYGRLSANSCLHFNGYLYWIGNETEIERPLNQGNNTNFEEVCRTGCKYIIPYGIKVYQIDYEL